MPSRAARHWCRGLLLAYPRDYRIARGDEIMTTIFDAAPQGPSLADQLDVIAAGLRERLGTGRIKGFEAGLALAAPVALALAAGISAFAWWRVEPTRLGAFEGGTPLFGVFRTLGPIAYAAWLLATLGWTVLPRTAGRVLVAVSIGVTLALPVISPLSTVDRPPLWVLMTLAAFGAITLAGTAPLLGAGRPPTDERIAVPAGAVAVALAASLVMLAWPPTSAGFGYYYQPTVARVGIAVSVAVAAVAAFAIWRRGAQQWLWATVLLGLPASWLGPFDSTGLLHSAPRFGRLAQVLLATCIAVAALVWLAGRRSPRLHVAGAWALGTSIGFTVVVAVAHVGRLGFTAGPVPAFIWVGVSVLAGAGLLAKGLRWPVLGWVPVTVAETMLVAWYDNGWTLGRWAIPGPTLTLALTIAVPPLSACAFAALSTVDKPATPRRIRRALVAAISLTWLGYVALPYAMSWGPVLLVLTASGLAVFLASRGRQTA